MLWGMSGRRRTNVMADTFYTIAAASESIVREKMSRFLAFAFRVSTAEEARERVAEIGRRYHDARHVCWAYMLGSARDVSMSNDNGEPSGTAGKPILGQINSLGLTDIVVVVVRYFGGIKLGTSGLIAAYREAARSCLEAAQVIECHDMARVSFRFPYVSMNAVMKVAKGQGVRIVEQKFDNTCSMTVEVRADDEASVRGRLMAVDGVTPE